MVRKRSKNNKTNNRTDRLLGWCKVERRKEQQKARPIRVEHGDESKAGKQKSNPCVVVFFVIFFGRQTAEGVLQKGERGMLFQLGLTCSGRQPRGLRHQCHPRGQRLDLNAPKLSKQVPRHQSPHQSQQPRSTTAWKPTTSPCCLGPEPQEDRCVEEACFCQRRRRGERPSSADSNTERGGGGAGEIRN